jgi:hypothetical protein
VTRHLPSTKTIFQRVIYVQAVKVGIGILEGLLLAFLVAYFILRSVEIYLEDLWINTYGKCSSIMQDYFDPSALVKLCAEEEINFEDAARTLFQFRGRFSINRTVFSAIYSKTKQSSLDAQTFTRIASNCKTVYAELIRASVF